MVCPSNLQKRMFLYYSVKTKCATREFLTAPVRLVKVITHNIADKRHLDSTVTTPNLAAPGRRQHF